MKTLITLLLTTLLFVPTQLHAQDASSEDAEQAASATLDWDAAAETELWKSSFLSAWELLLSGRIERAQRSFEALIEGASTAEARARVEVLSALCADLLEKEVAFVSAGDLGESDASNKLANRRSTDEIAVLYTNAVLYGLGSGVYLGIFTEPDSPAMGILPALALAGAAAAGVYAFDAPYGYGVPHSASTGLMLGLAEGSLLVAWNQARVRGEDEWSAELAASIIWGSATAGLIGGGLLGEHYGTTPGRASWVGETAFWGAYLTGMTVASFVGDDGDLDEIYLLSSIIGLNIGGVVGVLTAKEVSPSVGRVRFLDLGGLSGALLFGGLYISMASEDGSPEAFTGSLALGSALGLATAWFLTDDMSKDTRPGETSSTAMTFLPVDGGAMVGLGGRF